MDVTEKQRIDAVRAHLIQRYQFLDADRVDTAIQAAHHRFDGCQIRGFVPLLVERAATPRPRRIPDHHTARAVTTAPDTPASGGRREHRRQSRGVCRRHTTHRVYGSHPLSPARKDIACPGHQPQRRPKPPPQMGQSNTGIGRPG
ncbi:three-helix bundle dimerization domain-containing protein [Rhodococcus sp. LB1]|uniref:three-helix bundle dimerization domain-containing protein n=1 Tax=Rhodococcus sp. LB1 TaxID=1807499 RepID=UPI0009ED6D55